MLKAVTVVEAFTEIEKITREISDTYIRHHESEIKYTQEKAKLTLWIIGLSIGIELFILNKLDKHEINSIYKSSLLIIISFVFVFNAFLGLLTVRTAIV